MTTPPKYPAIFYVAHKLFDIQGVKQWGEFLDGPVDSHEELIEIIIDNFRDEKPSRENLRVWWIFCSTLANDVTDDVIEYALARIGDDDE